MATGTPDRIETIRAFNRFYTQRLGTLNPGLLDSPLSLAQARVLWELAHRDSWSAAELGRQLELDPSYLSRILADFGERGWLERATDAGDARRTRLALTPAGREAFLPLDQASRTQLEGWLAPLAEPDRGELAAAMATIQGLLEGRPAGDRLVVLRPHRPGDLGWLIGAQAELYAREYGWNAEFEALVAEIGARFLRRYDPDRERCWVAELQGRRVGSVTLVAKTRTVAQLRMLFVDERVRGLGIGRRLVAECLALARTAGYRKVVLWTNDCLVSARRIYQACGFTLAKSEAHHSFGQDLVGQYWELNLR